MIATMAVNTPKSRDKNRTTLLVVPAALLTQVRFADPGHDRRSQHEAVEGRTRDEDKRHVFRSYTPREGQAQDS